MTLISFITGLKSILPESNWPWVFAALHHDPLIWEGLSGEFGDRVLNLNSSRPEDYSPAALVLLALELPKTTDHLRVAPMQPALDEEVDEWAIMLADDLITQAGLLALEMREQRRIGGSWDGVISEVSTITPTALACLYGMIPDPIEFLMALVGTGVSNAPTIPGCDLALHALLSNPLQPRAHLWALKTLLKELSPDRQLDLLRSLSYYRPDLAAKLSQDIRGDLLPRENGHHPGTIDDAKKRLIKYVCNAELHQLEDDPVQSIAVLEESIEAARHLQAQLAGSLAKEANATHEPQRVLIAWEQATDLDPESPDLQAGYALALLDAGRTADAQTRLSASPSNHPSLMLANAVLCIRRGEHEEARQAACQALDLIEKEHWPNDIFPATYTSRLAEILLELNLPRQATQAAEIALTQKPNDPDILTLITRTWSAAAQPESALLTAHTAVALSPERADLRLQLAESQEIAGDWLAALKERSLFVEELESPSADDLLSLANCALKAGQPESATQLCEHLIQLDDSDGEAYVVLGEARAAADDSGSALEYLHQATNLTPDHSMPWLALARFYKGNGQNQKALETLQAATHAAPELPEIQLALGKTYLEQNKLTQALTSLRSATDLLTSSPRDLGTPKTAYQYGDLNFQTSLRLGQTLHQLGHLEEARGVLEDAYLQAPTYPELAQSYAQSLLDLGETRQAITPLETILNSEPKETTPYLNYARCLLDLHQEGDPQIDIERAIPVLQRALEITPDHPEAMVLLAETYAASDDLLPAMEAYNKAMETDLAKEPAWHIRLSLGVGQVALKLGQIETAVAALQEAYQADPSNPQVLRSLSEAYDAAGLTEDAFQTAHTALSLAPAEVETLTWFANQVENLQTRPGFNIPEAHKEVIDALERATQIEPQRSDLWIKLGQTHLDHGDDDAALSAFKTLADIQNPSSLCIAVDLYLAAQGLMKLGEASCAVTCLERALQPDYTPMSQTDPSLLEILTALSAAHYQNGDSQAALGSLNQAIMVAPDEPSLYIDKANLLLESGGSLPGPSMNEANIDEALFCLETALELNPNDPSSQYRAALIKRSTGDLPAALEHARQLINISLDSNDQIMASRTLAANLALAMLQSELARSYLDYREPSTENSHHGYHLDFHCLQAELALDAGEDHIAVNELVKILEIAPEEPRVLAIQARLSSNRGDYQTAVDTFNKAWVAIGEPSTAPVSTIRPVAKTALATRQWDKAIQLWNGIVENAPLEPQSHISLARALVLRAEYERLCQALDIVNRATGDSSLDEDAHRAFEVAIIEAEELTSAWEKNQDQAEDPKGKLLAPQMTINRWRVRGKAIFEPCTENAQALAEMSHQTAGDVAALVACLRHTGELNAAGMAAREHPQDPLILIQLALALQEAKPRQAAAAVRAAAEVINQPRGQYPTGSTGVGIEIEPIILALQARQFHNNRNGIEDHANALKSIQTALMIWPDEPRWHSLAAEIHLSDQSADDLANFEAAIPHLAQAIQLEPEYAPPYLTLGQIYLQEGSLQGAIQTIEAATRLVPDQPRAWMMLAQAYLATGDLDQAGAYAERAVTLSPNQVEPLLLRGEIDLKASNPSGAQSRAQAALRIDPDDMAAMSLMARALCDLGRTEEALSLLEIALQNAPDSLPLSLEKVRIIRHAKGHDQALQAISELSERYPDEPSILALQAQALDETGESEKAIQAAQRALRWSGGTTPLTLAEQAKLHYLLGCSFRHAGQLDQAVHHLSEAIRLSPEMVEAYLELASTHQERREHNQALNVYRQITTAVPNDYRAYYQIGLSLKEIKDYIGAEEMLRQAAELAPNEPSIHRLLAAVVALNLVHKCRPVKQDMQVNA